MQFGTSEALSVPSGTEVKGAQSPTPCNQYYIPIPAVQIEFFPQQ